MTYTYKQAIAWGALFAMVLAPAAPALAESADASAGVDAVMTAKDTETDASVTQHNETDLDLIHTSTSSKGNSDSDSDVEEDVDDDDSDDSDHMSSSTEMEVEEEMELEHGQMVIVKKVEVRGWDEDQKIEFLQSVKAAVEVRSGQELEHFAQGVLLRDENVDSVETEATSTRVSYRMPAKFLGIFEVSLPADTEVTLGDINGKVSAQVKVRFPWYGFLFAKQVRESDLEAQIAAALPVGDGTQATVEHQAQILQVLSTVLKAAHDAARNAINNIR